jgi:hypothetical protein
MSQNSFTLSLKLKLNCKKSTFHLMTSNNSDSLRLCDQLVICDKDI